MSLAYADFLPEVEPLDPDRVSIIATNELSRQQAGGFLYAAGVARPDGILNPDFSAPAVDHARQANFIDVGRKLWSLMPFVLDISITASGDAAYHGSVTIDGANPAHYTINLQTPPSIPGPQGIQGIRGATGAQGIQGIPGVAGASPNLASPGPIGGTTPDVITGTTITATVGYVGAFIAPIADGINAIQITKADRITPVLDVDTTNSRVSIGNGFNAPTATLGVLGVDTSPTNFAMRLRSTGGELITATNDRTFAGAGNWTGANWAVVAGVFRHTVGAVTAATLPNASLTALQMVLGDVYRVTFTVTGRTAGSLTPTVGFQAGSAVSVNGTYTQFIINNASTANLIFTPSTDFDGAIDNISVVRLQTLMSVANDGATLILGSGTTQPKLSVNGAIAMYGTGTTGIVENIIFPTVYNGTNIAGVGSGTGNLILQSKSTAGLGVGIVTGAAGATGVRVSVNDIGLLTSTITDAVTNTVTDAVIIDHSSSGTGAPGYGTGFRIRGRSDFNFSRDMSRIRTLWTTATDASRKARLVLSAFDTAERDVIAIEASGTAPMLGVLGATPVVRPTITGSRGANAALASLLTALALAGYITDSTTV